MEISAKLSNAPISAQKGRLMADLIRGMPVGKALDILRFNTRKAAAIFHKILESAIANAEQNEGADIDELKISTVYVDDGPTQKRVRARAKGRANRIIKRSCHITIKVAESE